MKKIDYNKLEGVKVLTTHERTAPDPNAAPINRDELNLITPAEPKTTVAPAAVPVVAEPQAPPVTQAEVTPGVPAAPEGIPSVSSDGTIQVENNSANTSTDDDSEIKEDELPEGIRKRFSKLTTKRKEAENKAKEFETKGLEKQSELDAKQKELEFYKDMFLNPKTPNVAPVQPEAKVIPAVTVVEEKEPVFKDFEDAEDPISAFVDAKTDWKVKKALAPVLQNMNPAFIEQKRKLDAVRAEHLDYQQTVTMENPAIKMLSENPITNAMIPASQDNLKIAYYLAKNPAEAKRIAAMTDPIDIAIELREVQKKIKPVSQSQTQIEVPAPVVATVVTPDPKPIQQTKAPVPFKPVTPVGSATLPPVDSDSVKPDDLRNRPGYEFLNKKRA